MCDKIWCCLINDIRLIFLLLKFVFYIKDRVFDKNVFLIRNYIGEYIVDDMCGLGKKFYSSVKEKRVYLVVLGKVF